MASPHSAQKQTIIKKCYSLILNLIHKLFKENENMKMWYSQMMEVKMLSTKLVSGYSFSTFLDE